MNNFERPLAAILNAKEQLKSVQEALMGLGSNVKYPLELAIQNVDALSRNVAKLQEEAMKKRQRCIDNETMFYDSRYMKQGAMADLLTRASAAFVNGRAVHDSVLVKGRSEGLKKGPIAPVGTGKGHSAQHHGLQKHSVGGIYPWAIVGIGNGEKTHYEIHHLVTGEHICHRVRGAHETLSFNGSKAYSRAAACIERVLAEGIDSLNGGYIHTPTSHSYRKS